MVDRYPPIAEHGMVGDLQTAALVSSAGTIDWWCTPRFDSPSVFASLLDSERGGHCRFAVDLPEGEGLTVRQLYLSDTAVLITRYMAPGGVGEVADFMPPVDSPTPTDRHRIIRIARVVRGSLPFTFSCRPRFDYARAPHTLTLPPDDDRTILVSGLTRGAYAAALIVLGAVGIAGLVAAALLPREADPSMRVRP